MSTQQTHGPASQKKKPSVAPAPFNTVDDSYAPVFDSAYLATTDATARQVAGGGARLDRPPVASAPVRARRIA